MVFLKLMVFSVVIMLASSKKGGKKGRFRSLTALVEQQTKRISEITNRQTVIEEKLVKEIEALKETFAEELKARKNDVMVVSGEEDLREERCAKVCAGTSGRGATNWVDYSLNSNGLYADVDISKCGFLTIPTVTTSLEFTSSHWSRIGASEITRVTTGSFRIFLAHPPARGGAANEWGWNVEWIAVGYTC
ncbi:uncharacterized protein LOC134819029 [Bolinopsis microptera]|uniref:uncharacterized protein LOC134819029 n=1 Tax=Bolinopsis microptera TaxID=2820187 RepID=UPI00307998DC